MLNPSPTFSSLLLVSISRSRPVSVCASILSCDNARTCNSPWIVQRSYRLLSLPARLARHARARVLKISRTWPWKDAFLACWHRLCALPVPA